jgi:hypothetical protein
MSIRKFVLLLVVVSPVVAAGCSRLLHHQIRGSGVRKTEQRQVAPFTAISTEGAFDIEVVAQKDQSLEVEADDNVLPSVETEVSGSVLHISMNGSFLLNNEVRIRIGVPDLNRVSASGAGTINVAGLKNEKFEISVNGAPTVRASGETNVLRVSANGAAKIDAMKLRASNVTVDSNGVSNVQVFARAQLNVTVSGPSHVTYAGDPEVSKTINGPGSVEKRESSGM